MHRAQWNSWTIPWPDNFQHYSPRKQQHTIKHTPNYLQNGNAMHCTEKCTLHNCKMLCNLPPS